MNVVKVALTGAAGQIGYHLAYNIARGDVFGADTKVAIMLIDLPMMQDALQGLIMEMEDSDFGLLESVTAVSSDQLDEGFDQIDFAFLVGASPRTKGMERGDLLAKNGEIFRTQGMALSKYAKKDCQVLVVGNPCNANCLLVSHFAKDMQTKTSLR